MFKYLLNCIPAVFIILYSTAVFSNGGKIEENIAKSDRRIRIFDTNDGLSNPIVTSILQDDRGFLWFGTYYGLNRYDGKNFLKFSGADGLIFDVVRDLKQDRTRRIWIATDRGVCYWKDGKFETLIGTGKFEKSTNIISVYKKFLFFGTNEGMHIYNSENGKLTELSIRLEDSSIIDIVPDESASVLYFSTKKEFVSLKIEESRDSGNFYEKARISLREKTINSIGKSRNGKILISFSGKGIAELDRENNSFSFLEKIENITLKKSGTYSFNKTPEGIIHSFRNENGIYYHDDRIGEYSFINNKYGLVQHDFISGFMDHENTLWVGTYGTGLIKAYRNKNVKTLKVIKKGTEIRTGMIDPNTRYIFRDSNGRIVMGTSNALIIKENDEYLNLTEDSKGRNKIKEVRWIIEDSKKKSKYWFAANNGIWFYENGKADRIEVTKDKVVFCLEQLNGQIVFNDSAESIYSFDPEFPEKSFRKEDKKQIIWYMKKTKENGREFLILQGPENVFAYYGHNSFETLFSRDSLEKEIQNFSDLQFGPMKEIKRHSFGKIEKMFYSSSEDFIIAFDTYLYFPKNQPVRLRNFKKDLKAGFPVSMTRDHNGVVWIGTSTGVIRFDPDEDMNGSFPSTLYTTHDGLSGDFSQFSSIAVSEKEVYVGSSKGVSVISLNKPYLNAVKPKAAIMSIRTKNNSKDNEGYNSLTGTEDYWNDLSYSHNDIVFGFAVLSFVNPNQNRLEFKLENYDKHYIRIEASNRDAIYYTNLPEGNYSFKIKGTNNDGVESSIEEFKFRIHPPIYRSKLAYFMYFLLLAGSVFLFFKIRFRQLKAKEKELEKLVDQKTDQLVKEKERISDMLKITENELSIGKSVQSFLIPPFEYANSWSEIFGHSVSSKELGGDFFQVLTENENSVHILIGDVSGKGVGSALIMTSTLSLMNHFVRNGNRLSKVMEQVNRGLANILELKRRSKLKFFVTASIAKIRKKKNRAELEWSNAGHMPPIILRNDTFINLENRSLAMGVDRTSTYSEEKALLKKNDILLFYTDGIIEQENVNGQYFGTERLMEIIQKNSDLSAKEIIFDLFEKLDSFRGEIHRSDDWTVVLMKI